MNYSVDTCHCGMCRRWGGGPLMFVDCRTDVTFEGEENIAVYDSSDWAERAFCKKCGSHLFYRLKHNNAHQMLVGQFQDQEKFHFDLQVYMDSKPAFYDFANKTRELTEAEVIDEFGPYEKK
ncbi:MAG: GFA family protein [Gammaproteobacteria bacterium]|nr:MAG: GFA family protein [Gammaproteobacteria bacterium]